MAELTHEERLGRELDQLLAPLREHYAEVDNEIERIQKEVEVFVARKQAEIAELRKTKGRIRSLIRTQEPSFDLKSYKKPNGHKKKKQSGTWEPDLKNARVVRVSEWLQEHAEEVNAMNDGTGFYVTNLITVYDDIPEKQQSALNKICRVLHDGGVLRLNSIGAQRQRYYKVVT